MVRESLQTSMYLTRSQMKSDAIQPYPKRMKTSYVSCSVHERDMCNYDLENKE